MARTKLTCTCEKCGTTFVKWIYGYNSRDASSRADYLEGYYTMCDECRRDEERAKELVAAEKVEQQYNLPELEGTERQISWGRVCRGKVVRQVGEYVSEQSEKLAVLTKNSGKRILKPDTPFFLFSSEDFEDYLEKLTEYRDIFAGLLTLTSASEWIDLWDYFKRSARDLLDNKIQKEREKAEAARKAAERKARLEKTTIRSGKDWYDGLVEISISPQSALFRYPFNDDFRTVVKANHCKWDWDARAWYQNVSLPGYTSADIAAEVGNALVLEGFDVTFLQEEVYQKALDKTYTTRAQAIEKQEEDEAKRTLRIPYKDYKNGKWKGKISKKIEDSYNSRRRTIEVIARDEAALAEMQEYYDNKSGKQNNTKPQDVPAEIRKFQEGHTNEYHITPPVLNPDDIDDTVPEVLKNEA